MLTLDPATLPAVTLTFLGDGHDTLRVSADADVELSGTVLTAGGRGFERLASQQETGSRRGARA